MLPFSLLLAALVGCAIHVFVSSQPRSQERISDLLSRWLFALPVGCWGLLGAYGHTVMADEIAQSIGWQTSPFQFEVAMTNLAFGISGWVAVFAGRGFRWAAWLNFSIFLWGAAYGHIHDTMTTGNQAPNNSGLLLYMDILLPVFLFIALWLNHKAARQGNSAAATVASMPA